MAATAHSRSPRVAPTPPLRPAPLATAMAGSWTASASSLSELDDALILHSPGFDGDDPSSYLLYPPGFGPVEHCLALSPSPGRQPPVLLPGETGTGLLDDGPDSFGLKGGDLGLAGSPGAGVELGEGSGGLQVGGLPLSDALCGLFCFAGTSDCDGPSMSSSVPHCGGAGNGVDEYILSGNSAEKRDVEAVIRIPHDADVHSSGCSVTSMCRDLATAREGVIRGRGAPVVFTTKIKVEGDDGGETNSWYSGFSKCEGDGSSSSSWSSFSSSLPPIGGKNSEEESGDFQGDDGNGDNSDGGKGKKMDEVADLEEGEIRTLDAEEAVVGTSTDGDEVEEMEEAMRSIHHLQVLPPVPSRKHTLEPLPHTLPVGVISSIVGNKVIVEGIQKHQPLSKGSVLWITKMRTPLGPVDEILGAGKSPFYVVRYNSEEKVPPGISEGAAVSFVIIDDWEQYKERYDACDQDRGVSSDEMQFSDGEKEAELIRCLQQAKRRAETRRQINQESLQKRRFQLDRRRAQFYTSGLQQDAQPLVSCASTPSRQPPHCLSCLQGVGQPPHVPRWMQSPRQAPHIPAQPLEPPWQAGQLQAQTPSPLHWFPGEYQASPLAVNNRGESLPCFLGDGQVCLGGLPVVDSVPCVGKPVSPFGAEQQYLLTQDSNAAWDYGSHQHFGMGLPIVLPLNGMPCQQPLGPHAFHQHHDQAFQHFTYGVPFHYHCGPNQGMPHGVSCGHGGLPNPCAPLRCLGSTGHGSFSQSPSGHMSACEGVLGLRNGNRNLAQFQPATGQGDVHRPPGI